VRLLYVVSAAVLGSDTARRIFDVESDDPRHPLVAQLGGAYKDRYVGLNS